jgi:hypothetical protein
MAYPVAKVYIAFNDGPYEPTPTYNPAVPLSGWTDVTSSVRAMSIDRGRSDDWDTFNGSATVVLNNLTRLYDPFYTSGTYFGKLLPRRQVKVEATYGGTTYPLFRGFIDGWPPSWTDAGKDSTVTLSCYDAMQLLAQVQLPADWSRSYILTQSPRHYYPLDDPIIQFQTGALTDIGSSPINMTYGTNAAPGSQLAMGLANGSLAGAGNNFLTGIATNDPGLGSRAVAFTANANFTVAFWCVPETNAAGIANGQASNFGWYVNFSSGKFTFSVDSFTDQATYSYTTTTAQLNQAEAYHFAVAWNGTAKTAVIYVNGVDVTGTKSTALGIVLATSADFVTVSQGPIQQILVFTGTNPSQAVIQNIIRYSQASFYETTGARVSRIIAETPFSASLVSANGTQYISDITDDAPYAMPELQQTANTEGAPIYVSDTGVLTQTATYTQFTQAKSFTSQATYGSGGLSLDPEIGIQYDGDSMRNIINVEMSGGGVQKSTGSVSTSTYGQAAQSWPAYMPTVAQAKTIGNLLVGFGQYVFPKFDDFEVVLRADGDWSTTLALELLERVTVAVAPPTGNTITKDLQVNRIRHDVVPGQWSTTLNGSNRWASAFRIGYSVLDGPDVIVYTA